MHIHAYREIYTLINNARFNLDWYALLILGLLLGSLAFVVTLIISKTVSRTNSKLFINNLTFVLGGYAISVIFWLYASHMLTPIMNMT